MSIKADSAGNQYVDVDLTTEIQKRLQAATSMDEKRRIVYRYIMDNLRGKYPTNDGREVIVTKLSAKELKHSVHENSIRVIPEIASIIKAGQLTEIKKVDHKQFAKFAYYDVALKIGDDYYTANVNIGIRENGESVLYAINQLKKITGTLNVGGVRNPVTVKGPVLNAASSPDISKLRRSAPAEEAAAKDYTNNISDSEPKSKQKNKNFSTAPAKPTLLTSLGGDVL